MQFGRFIYSTTRMASSVASTPFRGINGRESFINILPTLREQSDIEWILRRKQFPQFKFCSPRTPSGIMDCVLKSQRVQDSIEWECGVRNWPRKAVEMEAKEITKEMGHAFHMGTVRSVGVLIHKVVQKIFTGLYVNPERVKEIRGMCGDNPVILLPTHRTYMDFLLISYLCFEFEFPLPAIAAAMDFFHMKGVGELLRRCGAFFIRRSFGNDVLYWSIFTEYVQTHICNGDRPLEFYLEGTRSRTGKSLYPKVGLMSTVLEPFLRRQVYDIILVPISMSYSKVLEETLYAYELLGFPKPKESTSGLMKARTILDSNFGDIFVSFCRPISVREYMGNRLSGVSHSLKPGFRFEMDEREQVEVKKLASRILQTHQEHAVVSLWALAALSLNQILAEQRNGGVVEYDFLCKRIETLLDLTQRMNFHVPFHVGSLRDDLRYFCEIHSNLVSVDWEGVPRLMRIKPVKTSAVSVEGGNLSGSVIDEAVPRIILSNYGNTAMHMYACTGFVALTFAGGKISLNKEFLWQNFHFLQNLFEKEFIFVPEQGRRDLEVALGKLCEAQMIVAEESASFRVVDSNSLDTLRQLIQPFLSAYWVTCDTVCYHNGNLLLEKVLISSAQSEISNKIAEGSLVPRYQMLSTDMLKNAVHSLLHIGGLKKATGNGERAFIANQALVREIQGKLECFMEEVPRGKPMRAKI